MKKLALFFCLLAGCCPCDKSNRIKRTYIGELDNGVTVYILKLGDTYYYSSYSSIGPPVPKEDLDKFLKVEK